MAPMLFASLDIRRDDYDYALGVRMTEIWRRTSRLLLHGDYYPLTPFSRGPDRWVARQFDQPDVGEGLIQGIRLAGCAEDRTTVFPKALDRDSNYLLENAESGETRLMPGSSLLSVGITFELPRRSGAIWFYRRT
jgi:alpha-galactosidase